MRVATLVRNRNRLESLVWDLAKELRDLAKEFRDLATEFREFKSATQEQLSQLQSATASTQEQLAQFRSATQSEFVQLRSDMRSEFELVHGRIDWLTEKSNRTDRRLELLEEHVFGPENNGDAR